MNKARKTARRLARRQAAWAAHGRSPKLGNNPSNGRGDGHDMHRPGSQNPRKR